MLYSEDSSLFAKNSWSSGYTPLPQKLPVSSRPMILIRKNHSSTIPHAPQIQNPAAVAGKDGGRPRIERRHKDLKCWVAAHPAPNLAFSPVPRNSWLVGISNRRRKTDNLCSRIVRALAKLTKNCIWQEHATNLTDFKTFVDWKASGLPPSAATISIALPPETSRRSDRLCNRISLAARSSAWPGEQSVDSPNRAKSSTFFKS